MFIVHLIWLWWLTQMQFKFKVGAFSFITFASLPSLTRITNPYLSSWVSNATTVDSVPTSVCILFVSLSLSLSACVYIMYIYTVIYIYTHYAWSYYHTSLYAHCCVFHVPFLLVEIGDAPVLCGFIDGFTSSSLGYQNLSMSFHHLAAKNQKMPTNQHKSTSRIFMTTKFNILFISIVYGRYNYS